jgi:hypothetical protein
VPRSGSVTRHPRSVTLPGIGTIRVHDDTRKLRRLLAKHRGKILFATISQRAGRWWVSLNVEAADLHVTQQHSPRDEDDRGGWVGVGRGLAAFAVAATADGHESTRINNPPKALAAGMVRQRHLHQVSNELVKTHDRLAVEDLNVATGRPHLHLRMRTIHRPRHQRRDQPRRLGRTVSCPGPGPRSTRPGHQRPPRGRPDPRTSASETSPNDVGTEPRPPTRPDQPDAREGRCPHLNEVLRQALDSTQPRRRRRRGRVRWY